MSCPRSAAASTDPPTAPDPYHPAVPAVLTGEGVSDLPPHRAHPLREELDLLVVHAGVATRLEVPVDRDLLPLLDVVAAHLDAERGGRDEVHRLRRTCQRERADESDDDGVPAQQLHSWPPF